jgi:hypothetical protein
MVIAGEWRLEEDGITRPILEIDVIVTGGTIVHEPFLLDTGADCSVFTARLLTKLALSPAAVADGASLQGLGGESESVVVEASLVFRTIDGRAITVKG